MRSPKYMQNVLIGATAALIAGARYVPGHGESGPILTAATSFVRGEAPTADSADVARASTTMAAETRLALSALGSVVRPLSDAHALEAAFKS